jgi:hypothetical protein
VLLSASLLTGPAPGHGPAGTTAPAPKPGPEEAKLRACRAAQAPGLTDEQRKKTAEVCGTAAVPAAGKDAKAISPECDRVSPALAAARLRYADRIQPLLPPIQGTLVYGGPRAGERVCLETRTLPDHVAQWKVRRGAAAGYLGVEAHRQTAGFYRRVSAQPCPDAAPAECHSRRTGGGIAVTWTKDPGTGGNLARSVDFVRPDDTVVTVTVLAQADGSASKTARPPQALPAPPLTEEQAITLAQNPALLR